MPQITEIYLDKEDDVLDYSKRVIFAKKQTLKPVTDDLERSNSLQLEDEDYEEIHDNSFLLQ